VLAIGHWPCRTCLLTILPLFDLHQGSIEVRPGAVKAVSLRLFDPADDGKGPSFTPTAVGPAVPAQGNLMLLEIITSSRTWVLWYVRPPKLAPKLPVG
jgi:hypothetical protein